MQQEFYSIPELADRWRVSASTIRRMIAAGELAKVYISAQVRIERAEVERLENLSRRKAKNPVNVMGT